MMMPSKAVPVGAEGQALYKRLWIHEVMRVFHDRLVDTPDRSWLLAQVGTEPSRICDLAETRPDFMQRCLRKQLGANATRLRRRCIAYLAGAAAFSLAIASSALGRSMEKTVSGVTTA